jgi:hypothetical protein
VRACAACLVSRQQGERSACIIRPWWKAGLLVQLISNVCSLARAIKAGRPRRAPLRLRLAIIQYSSSSHPRGRVRWPTKNAVLPCLWWLGLELQASKMRHGQSVWAVAYLGCYGVVLRGFGLGALGARGMRWHGRGAKGALGEPGLMLRRQCEAVQCIKCAAKPGAIHHRAAGGRPPGVGLRHLRQAWPLLARGRQQPIRSDGW